MTHPPNPGPDKTDHGHRAGGPGLKEQPSGGQRKGSPALPLIEGIFSIILSSGCGMFGLPIAILGIIASARGMKHSGDDSGRRGLAVAGLACSLVGLVIALVFVFPPLHDRTSFLHMLTSS